MENKKYYCFISGKEIPEARVEFLKSTSLPEREWTTVENSLARKKKGMFAGLTGISDFLIVDKIYDDSVENIMPSSDKEEELEES